MQASKHSLLGEKRFENFLITDAEDVLLRTGVCRYLEGRSDMVYKVREGVPSGAMD